MKKDIFDDYVNKVTSHYDVTKDRLFTKDKSREVVDARHMLYYLCKERPMSPTYIKQYMSDNGYDISVSTITHGIKRIEKEVSADPDYTTLIKKLK